MLHKNVIMGIAGSLIAAGLGWYVKGPNTGLIIAGAGVVLWLAVYLFSKKSDEGKQTPSPSIHVESGPKLSPYISPNISPSFNQTFNPTIKVEVPSAAAPSPVPDNRPKLTFDKWDTRGETLDIWESGFLISNHGETGLDVQVQRFQVAPGKFASSKAIATIPAYSDQRFIPVWLEGYSSVGFVAEKWDLTWHNEGRI